MSVLFIALPIALLLAGAAVAACRWCIADGQFDDVVTPALRMLRDD
jgi:cbb3-type cytochrome oxidase maturation protein